MKILTKDDIYNFVPKLNLFLSLSAVVLIAVLCVSLLRPYKINRTLKINTLANAKILSTQEIKTVFNQELFKPGRLFNELVNKGASKEKKVFILLGISVGSKNLAMLRDTKANKDYYCSEGDMVGEFKVRQILKDKVILESEGNLLEISR